MINIALNMVVYNESIRLKDALPKLRLLFDEIVIIDQASCDDTVQIARMYADRLIIDKHWGSSCYSRNLNLENTKNDWVLTLDADEEITPDFIGNMRSLVEQPYDGYFLKMSHLIDGVHQSDGLKYRFYKKQNVHNVIKLHGGSSPTPGSRTLSIKDYYCLIENKSKIEYENDHHRYISMTRDMSIDMEDKLRTAYGLKKL